MSDSLAEALHDFQLSLPHISKDAQGQRSSYASLPNVSKILLPELAALGLFFSCRPTMHPEFGFVLAYELTHLNGDTRAGFYPLPKDTPQTIGGSITYARRYALLAVTGVAPDDEDDDAEAAEAEARALERRRLPEVDEHGAATFAEQTRMVSGPVPGVTRHDRVPWKDRAEWETPSDEASKPDPMRAAMGAMFALYKELGVTEKGPMLFDISDILDHPVTSRADLSLEEVKAVNGVLRKRRDAARKAGSVTHA